MLVLFILLVIITSAFVW
ncbi:YjcZ family sporulation protein [Paenibacillus sp. LMG 31458]|uniref:YjcZ family sporulation protein n=1 Tax=Paenibacillus phytorum TaxID=2654977 RepID=A0ABX1XW90_9BACL|nr:YjcZ family sporulation protein [Paenibacillus phytorum]